MKIARKFDINGIVQGVGFRPFVYQLAASHELQGRVSNTSSGVSIHIEGPSPAIEAFSRELTENPPPLAHITQINISETPLKGYGEFSIRKSRTRGQRFTLISPDVSTCDDCLKEMLDPGDRRYRYPFINCTNCGPRYTIIDDIPYDRPKTSMRHFQMCDRCQAEYDDPMDRRFHAQPNACPVCGPHVRLHDNTGEKVVSEDHIADAVTLLKSGQILAVKGLGGFHLVVDAENQTAVKRLRQRKHREEKPLAVMSYDLDIVRQYASPTPEEEQLLLSPQRPIVLLPKKEPELLAEDVSPHSRYYGVMLPYTPLHHLLLKESFKALVMTSGNMSEEPIAIDNQDALERLQTLADYFLLHDRDIYLRSDDSVVKTINNRLRFFRRSRGYVPRPVFLKKPVRSILACGAELKNTICLTRQDQAFLGQHVGDLENLATFNFFKKTIAHLERILDIEPEYIACDMHPDYLSTRYAKEQKDIQVLEIQHHHAHIVACMAENQVEDPLIGLAFDGTGFGTDGCIWGGEILLAGLDQFERRGHLAYVPMPGGAAAIKEPWRMATSYLYQAYGKDLLRLNLPFLKTVRADKIETIIEMIEKRINSPYTSSLGRLFDGVAAMVGLREKVAFEGQAAMELEMAADLSEKGVYEYASPLGDSLEIPVEPIVREIVEDMQRQVHPSEISMKFHNTLIRLFADVCINIRTQTGFTQVALSGGVFQNAIMLSGLTEDLETKGFEVLSHTQIPSNDGGIALGQAVVADAMLSKR
ncbi:MAG: carbamoyltransferase HypF [Thermodesulfobacteriota bacterium]